MCIFSISKPDSPRLSKEVIYRCFERNPHGAGLAFARNNKISMVKGFFDPDDLWKYYQLIPTNSTILLHFRHASAGVIDHKNCHPWRIDKDHVMVHNGTIYDFWNEKSEISDTGHFVYQLLKPVFKKDKYFWRRRSGKYLFCKTIWPGKMIILRNNGDYVIFNENLGEWDDGTFWSNDGFRDESEYCKTFYPRQLYFPLEFKDETEDTEEIESISLLD